MSNIILNKNNRYQSPFGWQIDLPSGWHVIGRDNESASSLDPHAPVTVFCQDSEPSNSFTWMVNTLPVDRGVAAQFICLSMIEGPVAEEEVWPFLPRMFPAIGPIYAASIVEAEDGNRALEVLDAFQQEGVQKRGYQRIFLLRNRGQLYFQRVAFYAPLLVFEKLIDSIRVSARSLAYNRSYGFKPAPI